jgi:hypothetical protein
MLAKLKPHFDFPKQMDRSVWAITTVGVHAVCRLGELAPSKLSAKFYPKGGDYRLLDQDGTHASEILIHRSKSDKLFKGVWVTVPHNGIETSAHQALLDAYASRAPGKIFTVGKDPLIQPPGAQDLPSGKFCRWKAMTPKSSLATPSASAAARASLT